MALYFFKGILFAKPEAIKSVNELVRLYLHESERVYCDKLVEKEDSDLFYKIQRDVIKKSLEVIVYI
jgi:dynein heavy chain, axonemal